MIIYLAGDNMVANLNATIPICGTQIHIYSIATSQRNTSIAKTYYQHQHSGIEIHYVCKGQCKVSLSSKSYMLDSPSLILIPPKTYHDVVSTNKDTTRIIITFSVEDSKVSGLHDVFSNDTPTIATLNRNNLHSILTQIEHLLDLQGQDKYKNDKLLMLCGSLLLETIPYITDFSNSNEDSHVDRKSEDINFKIDSFLGTNFMHNNAKSRIASDLYVSPRQLQRIIKKNYGMSYRQKLSETRMQIAVDLLCNSDMPIHKISEILGYSCSANFSAFIKRATGKTPSKIRKER